MAAVSVGIGDVGDAFRSVGGFGCFDKERVIAADRIVRNPVFQRDSRIGEKAADLIIKEGA